MFKVLRTGKRKQKQWKRMVTKVTFVGQNFTRKPPKYERFIRPTGAAQVAATCPADHQCSSAVSLHRHAAHCNA